MRYTPISKMFRVRFRTRNNFVTGYYVRCGTPEMAKELAVAKAIVTGMPLVEILDVATC